MMPTIVDLQPIRVSIHSELPFNFRVAEGRLLRGSVPLSSMMSALMEPSGRHSLSQIVIVQS
jgi:hypothetical protein